MEKQAFPTITIRQEGDPAYVKPTRIYNRGMNLRDYFAAEIIGELVVFHPEKDADVLAKIAYEISDAMMRARNEKEQDR